MRLVAINAKAAYSPSLRSPAQGDVARTIRDVERKALKASLERRPYPYEELDATVANEINDRWKQPCEAMFEYLATHHPEQLVVLLRSSRLSSADLTFAAEIAGSIPDSTMVRPALVPLLSHANPVVREGAIYGLANHLDEPTRERLCTLANEDASRAVRTAASDALEPG